MKAIEVSLAAICTLLLVNVTQSAPEPRRERRPEPPPERREPPPEIFERILDEDQRAELRETFRENRERLREIEEQVRAGRRELHEAMLKGEVDEPEMKKKIDEIAKLEGERRFDESRPRFQDEPPPRGPAPRRQLDQRRPPPRDFPDNGDVPLPPPSRGRPDPE